MQRKGELVALCAIAFLIAIGGRQLLVTLGHAKTWGALLAAGLIVIAVRNLRGVYDPALPDARAQVTKGGAYLVAAILAFWAIVAPARWAYGSCIAAAEIAVVFDIITFVARNRVGSTGGS